MIQATNDLFQPISFPAFSITRNMKMLETPINNLIRRVERALPQYLNGNIATSVSLTDTDLRVRADAGQMEEALKSFIESARDAMPDGGRLTIMTGEGSFNGLRTRYGRCGFLSLTDTGVPRYFFSEAKNTDQAHRLRLACHIVQLHNGYTRIEGLKGFGTTVYVYLPLMKIPPEDIDAIPLGMSQTMWK
jgi:two-component system, cell cycle sensor histidine kinase and response regulator CckA